MNVLVFTPYLYDTAPGQRFRIEQWARKLESQVRFEFVPFESPKLKQIYHSPSRFFQKTAELIRSAFRRAGKVAGVRRKDWDLIFLHRELLPALVPVLERVLARQGVPILYDFDDAIFLPETSEANRWFQWLKYPQKTGTLCRLSTHVIVGNAYLKEYAQKYNPRVTVIPTTIDTERYIPKQNQEIGRVPVIGWSGSLTTVKHLRTIEPALKALAKKLSFCLKVIGSNAFYPDGLTVEQQRWNPQTEQEELKSFDVGLMPLPDDAWSKGKCGLKALQYMALGVPAIVSPVGVNTEIIQDGQNGFLASTQEEWVEKICRLVQDTGLRRQFARAGRATVESRYSANAQAPRLLEIFEHVRRRGIS